MHSMTRGIPTSAAVGGDLVSVPDLHGRRVNLDTINKIMVVLRHNADPARRARYDMRQDQWVEGVFRRTHALYWDDDGNLYVQDGNQDGHLIKFACVAVD